MTKNTPHMKHMKYSIFDTQKDDSKPSTAVDAIDTPISKQYAYSQFLDIEDMVIDRTYAITINPCDQYQWFSSGRNRLSNFRTYWKSYFEIQPYKIDVKLEVSPKGRLHWHGYITFLKESDLCNFYVILLHDFLSKTQIKIQTIDNEEEWKKYISKQDKFFESQRISTDGKSGTKQFRKLQQSHLTDDFLKTMDYFLKDV